MRYAIIADIHSNLEAFTAVLKDIGKQGKVEEIWCLGDVVGYGPDPHACIELLKQCNHVCVAGNHDWGAIGKIDIGRFNPDAQTACRWTERQLNPVDTDYLQRLPRVEAREAFTLVHGSPREPIWEYTLSSSIAGQNFPFFTSKYCFVGHTHVPMVFKQEDDGHCSSGQLSMNVGLALGKNRLIINPGGVGQPRDGDPRASYAIYDSEANLVKLYRLPYDFKSTQDKMMRAGLPVRLAARLSYGR
jgi:predicted phosphodiesterase